MGRPTNLPRYVGERCPYCQGIDMSPEAYSVRGFSIHGFAASRTACSAMILPQVHGEGNGAGLYGAIGTTHG